jgi:hypothetical protein
LQEKNRKQYALATPVADQFVCTACSPKAQYGLATPVKEPAILPAVLTAENAQYRQHSTACSPEAQYALAAPVTDQSHVAHRQYAGGTQPKLALRIVLVQKEVAAWGAGQSNIPAGIKAQCVRGTVGFERGHAAVLLLSVPVECLFDVIGWDRLCLELGGVLLYSMFLALHGSSDLRCRVMCCCATLPPLQGLQSLLLLLLLGANAGTS